MGLDGPPFSGRMGVSMSVFKLERQQEREDLAAQRLANERRFSPPASACPWACDGSGWRELPEGLEPDDLEIYHGGEWLTPCECNVGVAWFTGEKFPRRYPPDYKGPRIEPKLPTREELRARFDQIASEGR